MSKMLLLLPHIHINALFFCKLHMIFREGGGGSRCGSNSSCICLFVWTVDESDVVWFWPSSCSSYDILTRQFDCAIFATFHVWFAFWTDGTTSRRGIHILCRICFSSYNVACFVLLYIRLHISAEQYMVQLLSICPSVHSMLSNAYSAAQTF